MSYTFTILSPHDTPLFTHTFGTSRSSGTGTPAFTTADLALNPFIIHSALDIVEEVQWGPSSTSGSAPMYLKHIDKYQNNFISCWITGGNVRFLLLTRPRDEALGISAANPSSGSASSIYSTGSGAGSVRGSLAGGRAGLGGGAGMYNPTSPATEEAVKNFFVDVYESWVKTIMNPFFAVGHGDVVKSPVFRARVQAAAKKYL
ncbi:Sedlin [Lindgomyces ingoldianus]|uniref:Sedlin n=1 Tax=Lindgomyces ingoldianus TaxID=673940 RepID=A0ACB6QQT6_9PLEO|nr:Sedlin [Lindgomyces ingoldianus]KAF2469359.1 Sedlin [Lindgomyces ingoldianus]